jgi:hypothetical protein
LALALVSALMPTIKPSTSERDAMNQIETLKARLHDFYHDGLDDDFVREIYDAQREQLAALIGEYATQKLEDQLFFDGEYWDFCQAD